MILIRIRHVGIELFRVGGQAERHDEASRRFSHIFGRA